ncbi:MAG: MAPEG family protein [Candidatus Caenarcaniphilales bacterium]|nr:MAPEG family protein [Candidatus Caenarcaniphilales bacterium]
MISALFASILAFLYVVLVINVVRIRRAGKVAIGDAGNEELSYAIRAQSNFAEHVPLALLLIICLDLQEASLILVQILSLILVLARISHAASLLYFERKKNIFNFRVIGTAGTMTSILIAAIVNIYLFTVQ